MNVLEVAQELYGLLPADFTVARTEAEKAAKGAGDKSAATQIKALRRPSIGAWAVNMLVRCEADQIDQVLGIAASLREAAAALDGAELRDLTRQRRQLTAALTTRARQLAAESGSRLTPAVADTVEATLTAAMLDDGAAAAVRSGLLVTTLAATGVDRVDAAAAVAVPAALGTIAPRATESVGLRAVPDSDLVKRERAKDAVARAKGEVESAERAERRARAALEEAEGERMRLGAELDELQRRIAVLEEQLEAADETLAEAGETASATADTLSRRRADLAAAEADLDRL